MAGSQSPLTDPTRCPECHTPPHPLDRAAGGNVRCRNCGLWQLATGESVLPRADDSGVLDQFRLHAPYWQPTSALPMTLADPPPAGAERSEVGKPPIDPSSGAEGTEKHDGANDSAPSAGPERAEGGKPAPNPDGPFEADGFRFAGAEVRFGRAAKQYGLVLALWDKRKKRPQSPRPVEQVLETVYGHDNNTSDAALRQLISDTRQRFQSVAFPLEIKAKQGTLQLVRL